MNPPDPILDSLLVAVRATKRRRQWRRAASVSAACVIATACFLLHPNRRTDVPLVASPPPAPPTAREDNTLAVLVWHGSTPLFERMDTAELGSVELAFGLDPVIAYPDEPWGVQPN